MLLVDCVCVCVRPVPFQRETAVITASGNRFACCRRLGDRSCLRSLLGRFLHLIAWVLLLLMLPCCAGWCSSWCSHSHSHSYPYPYGWGKEPLPASLFILRYGKVLNLYRTAAALYYGTTINVLCVSVLDLFYDALRYIYIDIHVYSNFLVVFSIWE